MKVYNQVIIIVCILVWVLSIPAQATIFRSVKNKPNNFWNDPDSWDQVAVPGNSDTVVIEGGIGIRVNVTATIAHVEITDNNSSLDIQSGNTLTTSSLSFIPQANKETNSLVVDGSLVISGTLTVNSSGFDNGKHTLSGTGSIQCAQALFYSDEASNVISLELPISSTGNVTVQTDGAASDILVDAKDSLQVGGNLVLSTTNSATAASNLLSMANSGAVLELSNTISETGNGGTLENASNRATQVLYSSFNDFYNGSTITYYDVVITGTHSLSGSVTCSNILNQLIVESGVTVTLNSQKLTLDNDECVVNGAITGTGINDSLTFSGTAAQTLSGTGTVDVGVFQLNNTNGLTNSMPVVVYRFLALEQGTFTTGGQVTLNSNSSFTAWMTEIGTNGTGASISGNLTCELYMTGLSTVGYRNLTSPIQGTTINDFQHNVSPEGIWTYGFTGSNTPSSGGNSCYTYDPNAANSAADADQGWGEATNSTNSISPFEGWTFYVGGMSGEGAKTTYELSKSGTPYTGSVTLNSTNAHISSSITGVQTWGLIGNPFPCGIDWDLVSKTGISSVAQVYGLQDFSGFRATNFNSDARIIPPFQAFWVQSTSTGASITFEENDKLDTYVAIRKSALMNERLYVELKDVAKGYKLGACIELNPQAGAGFDSGLDGTIFENPDPLPNLYFPVQDTLHAQVYSTFRGDQVIPLSTYAASGQGGAVELTFTDLPMTQAYFTLEDRKLGKKVAIQKGTTYSFQLGEDPNEERFFIHVTLLPFQYQTVHNTCSGTDDGRVSFQLNQAHHWPELEKVDGTSIPLNQTGNQWESDHLEPGNYLLKIEDQQHQVTAIQEYFTIFEPAEVKAKFTIESGLIVARNEPLNLSNQSQGASGFKWLFEDGDQSSQVEPPKSFSSPGSYRIDLIADNGNVQCNDTLSKWVEVQDVFVSAGKLSQEEQKWLVQTGINGHYLKARTSSPSQLELQLLTLHGQILWEYHETYESGLIKIPTEQFSGPFILQIATKEESHTLRFH